MSPSLNALILFLCLSLADSKLVYGKLGGEVVLAAGSAAKDITSITWKHDGDFAVEWFGGEPSSYRHFNGCTALNTSTGALTVSGLTRSHSGSYTADINNQVADTTEVLVISPVPKPTISNRCDPEGSHCNLTCEGDTTDAEPVTYTWVILDMHHVDVSREFTITEENQEPWIFCRMKNPVSFESSEKFDNPFRRIVSRMHIFIGVPVLCLILLLIVFCIWLKCKSRKGKDLEGTAEEGKRMLGASSNGQVVTFLSVQETSDQTPTSSVVPESSRETETLNTSESPDQGKTSKETSDEPEVPPEMTVVTYAQVLRRAETPDSSDQTAATTSEVQETSVAESSNEAGASTNDSQDQQTSSCDLKAAASTDMCDETEKSAEESKVEEATEPLLEEQT